MSSSNKTNREFLIGIFLPIIFVLLLSIPVLFVAVFVSKAFLKILVEFSVRFILPITLAYVSYGLMAFEIHRRGTTVDLSAEREKQIPIITTYWREVGRHRRFPVLLILFFLSILSMVFQGVLDAFKHEKYGVLIITACFYLMVLQLYLFARRIKKRPNAIWGSTFYNHKVLFVFILSILIISFLTFLYLYYRYIDVNPTLTKIIINFIGPIVMYLEMAYLLYFITHTMFEGYRFDNHCIILPKTRILAGLVLKEEMKVAFDDIENIRIINNPTGLCELRIYLPGYEFSASFKAGSQNDFLEKIRMCSKKEIPVIEEAFSEEKNLKMVKLLIGGLLFIVFLVFVVIYLATMHLQ